ncbi:hypothetical protein [uncultured Pseudokineococcus sp.]|uniref:hypothetical protein n=1 Tax=uncultured Pseudokineococcus sp. TaxID=1642928 RepID=UPI0026060FD0|nr:hypothetical protein [uncultured Pseudokineococcus sp.]
MDRPVGAPRGVEEYEYPCSFVLGYTDPRGTAVTPEAVTAQNLDDFKEHFLYGSCRPRVLAGKQCELHLPGPISFPIQFDRTWPTGWEFTSLEGTEEGRMRWITFEVRYNDAGDRLVLDVHAKGPRSALLTSCGAQPVNTILTSVEWRRFAEKVASRHDLCDGKPWYRIECATPE